MALEIRQVDVADDGLLRDYHAVSVRAETLDGRDWTRPWTYDEMVVAFRDPDETERPEAYVAVDDGRVVGASVQWFFLLDNRNKTWLEVYVDPAERRRGVGSALVEYAVERARLDGRTQVTGESSCHFAEREDGPLLRFAAAHGFRNANMAIRRRLRLPVAEELLGEIATEVAAHQGDYVVESFVHGLPDALLPSYCQLSNQLAVEAPAGEFDWEAESVTPQILAEHLRKMAAVNRIRYTAVAHLRGEVVALSDIMVTKGETRAEQWATIVDRAHRGHRLGAAVKVANLRNLAAHEPQVTEVHTENAETNARMVGINERLGFEAIAVSPGLLRDL
jgi:GNAT superfamily N-acetyltransferase